MNSSKALVRLALKSLNCSQKQLSEELNVSPAQISKWLNHDSHISSDFVNKIRGICKIDDLPPELVEACGSQEKANKWDMVFRYLAQLSNERNEIGYESIRLTDYDDYGITGLISRVLIELGFDLSVDAPDLVMIEDEEDPVIIDKFFAEPKVSLISIIFDAYVVLESFVESYFAEVLLDEKIQDEDVNAFENYLMYLAASKLVLNEKLVPNHSSFCQKWRKSLKIDILDFRLKVIGSNFPLREEPLKLLSEGLDELTLLAERESLGFNDSQLHPDVYVNELLVGMRTIHQILPKVLEKLDIEFKLDRTEIGLDLNSSN